MALSILQSPVSLLASWQSRWRWSQGGCLIQGGRCYLCSASESFQELGTSSDREFEEDGSLMMGLAPHRLSSSAPPMVPMAWKLLEEPGQEWSLGDCSQWLSSGTGRSRSWLPNDSNVRNSRGALEDWGSFARLPPSLSAALCPALVDELEPCCTEDLSYTPQS